MTAARRYNRSLAWAFQPWPTNSSFSTEQPRCGGCGWRPAKHQDPMRPVAMVLNEQVTVFLLNHADAVAQLNEQ